MLRFKIEVIQEENRTARTEISASGEASPKMVATALGLLASTASGTAMVYANTLDPRMRELFLRDYLRYVARTPDNMESRLTIRDLL